MGLPGASSAPPPLERQLLLQSKATRWLPAQCLTWASDAGSGLRAGLASRPLRWAFPFLQVLPDLLWEGLDVLLDTREAEPLAVEQTAFLEEEGS